MTEIRYLLIRLAINVFKLCIKDVLTVNGFESKTKNHIQNLRFSKQKKNQNQIKLRNLHKTAAMWRFSCSTVDHSMFELFFFQIGLSATQIIKVFSFKLWLSNTKSLFKFEVRSNFHRRMHYASRLPGRWRFLPGKMPECINKSV